MPSEEERQSEIDRLLWTPSCNNFSWDYPRYLFPLRSEVSVAPAYSCKIQHYNSCDFCALTGLGTDRTIFLANSYTRRETNVCLLVPAVVHVLWHKNKKGFNVVERLQAWVKGILFLTSSLCTTIWNSSSHVSLLIEFCRFLYEGNRQCPWNR